MTDGQTLRVIPNRRRRRVRKIRRLTNQVILIVAPYVKRLPVCKVEIKFRSIGIVSCRRRSVEAKTAGVKAIAETGIVDCVALSFVAEE